MSLGPQTARAKGPPMPTRLTPEQATDPDTVERLAAAECAYDHIMSGRDPLLKTWWKVSSDEVHDEWRAKARAILAESRCGGVVTVPSGSSGETAAVEAIAQAIVDDDPEVIDLPVARHFAWLALAAAERFWRDRIAAELRTYRDDMKSGTARDIVNGCLARVARGVS